MINVKSINIQYSPTWELLIINSNKTTTRDNNMWSQDIVEFYFPWSDPIKSTSSNNRSVESFNNSKHPVVQCLPHLTWISNNMASVLWKMSSLMWSIMSIQLQSTLWSLPKPFMVSKSKIPSCHFTKHLEVFIDV